MQFEKYSFSVNKYIHLYLSAFQKEVEYAMRQLTEKYNLPQPLHYTHNWIFQCMYFAENSLSLTEISAQTGIALPNISLSVQMLIDDGILMQVSSENKRKKMISFTKFGRIIAEEYARDYLMRISAWLKQGITEEQSEAFKAYFLQIEKNILTTPPPSAD